MPNDLNFLDFSINIVIPKLIIGMQMTLKLTFISGPIGLIIGLLIAILKLSKSKTLKCVATIYINFFRGTPLLLQILFIYFALPSIININLDSFYAGILALSLNAGAYLAEIFRAGISSIPKGQTEASYALGLNYYQTLFKIIIPQSIRRIIPPVMNEFSSLTKETSLVSVISLSELLYVTQRIGAKYLRPWEVYFWASIGYLIIVLFLSYIAKSLEKSLLNKGGV